MEKLTGILIEKESNEEIKHDEPSPKRIKIATQDTTERIEKLPENGDNKEPTEDGKHVESPSNTIKLYEDEKTERGKRKKYVLLISYSGKNYYGMQIIKNDPLPTIEEELFDAMIKAELIEACVKECPQSISYQRAARTDKGVSAIKQVVSLKLRVSAEVNIPKVINEHLPECIRVMRALKVTKRFDAKNYCDFRTYSYTTPTFAFAPSTETPNANYRIPVEVIAELEKILQIYLGTHSYHNFSSRIKSTEERAKRYIMKVGIDGPFIRDEQEFLRIKIRGQSFMLHQIRKMIGFAMGICRGLATTEHLFKAFKDDHSDIPIAPALGLVLEEPHFENYNKKFSEDGLHERICWDIMEEDVEEFRKKFIDQNIVDMEKNKKVTISWLETLNYHSFAQNRLIRELKKNDNSLENIPVENSVLEQAAPKIGGDLQNSPTNDVSS